MNPALPQLYTQASGTILAKVQSALLKTLQQEPGCG